jgi:hypothetical protein
MLRFYPHRTAKKMRLEPYREAWHLLQSEEDAGKIEIQARADETLVCRPAPRSDGRIRPSAEQRKARSAPRH